MYYFKNKIGGFVGDEVIDLSGYPQEELKNPVLYEFYLLWEKLRIEKNRKPSDFLKLTEALDNLIRFLGKYNILLPEISNDPNPIVSELKAKISYQPPSPPSPPGSQGGNITPPPEQGGGTTIPPQGGGIIIPPQGGTTIPSQGGEITTPPQGGTTTPPQGGETIIPAGGNVKPSQPGLHIKPSGPDVPKESELKVEKRDKLPYSTLAILLGSGILIGLIARFIRRK